jgi:hypothetical protein
MTRGCSTSCSGNGCRRTSRTAPLLVWIDVVRERWEERTDGNVLQAHARVIRRDNQLRRGQAADWTVTHELVPPLVLQKRVHAVIWVRHLTNQRHRITNLHIDTTWVNLGASTRICAGA